MREWFSRIAKSTADAMGSSWTFFSAALFVLVWALSGPVFHFSDTWELVINTATTTITFLAVFLIQNAQNRGDEAIQLKLDELLRAVHDAHNDVIDAEDLTEEEMARRKKRLKRAVRSS